jgi:ELWxxDGT repeat protein
MQNVFAVVDGIAYFSGWDEAAGRELWRSDGTAAGTWRVADIAAGGPSSSPSKLTNVEGMLYFAANDGSGEDLWKSDGTAAGTVRIKDLIAAPSSNNILRIVGVEGRVYFFQAVGSQYTLWTSDGSEEGTIPLVSAVSIWDSAALGTQFIFQSKVGTANWLFATDGTTEGTHPLRAGYAQYLTNVNGTLFFSNSGLWKTDGTEEGTVLVKDGSAAGVRPSYLTNVDGTLYFQSLDALWKSDGTESGTELVDGSLSVDDLYAIGDTLYIINRDPTIGSEPWILRPSAAVIGRYLFYNESAFDDGSAAANAADDGAIAHDKLAYLPGSGLSTTASVSSYVRGINGIMIDVAGLDGELTLDDFSFRVGTSNAPETWSLAPDPLEIVVRSGAGVDGSDRVTITWAAGAIKNTWLQVVLKGNDAAGGFNTRSGLAESDVFFFGSRVGDTFAWATALGTVTNIQDELTARFAPGTQQPITSAVDFNRDGLVNINDQLIARMNAGLLLMIDAANQVDELAVALAAPIETVAHSNATLQSADGRSALAFALALAGAGERDDEEFRLARRRLH